jgi:arginase
MFRLRIVRVPYSNDVSRWGYAQGPDAILNAGLEARLAPLGGSISGIDTIELPRERWSRDRVANLGVLAAGIRDAVASARGRGEIPLLLGGDCTHAPGVAGGLAAGTSRVGVVWFDAHADLNTVATSPSGLISGMPLAVMLGWEFDDWRRASGLQRPLSPSSVALLGMSDLDPAEHEVLRDLPFTFLNASQLDVSDVERVVHDALRPLQAQSNAWQLHIDLDVSGPEENPAGTIPAVRWPARSRLLAALAEASRTLPPAALSVVGANPVGDPGNRAAKFAVEAVAAMCAGLD